VASRDVTLVDTNVLLDLVTNDPAWSEWSIARLEEAALAGPILINDVVYAETSIRYARIEDLDDMLGRAAIAMMPAPRSALFLAGKVFQRCWAAGGARTAVVPDFFIGAHASVEG
jgi:predicted nucleic acid-binding protein